MVQNLSIHSKKVAALLFWILYGSLIGEAWAGVRSEPATFIKSSSSFRNSKADSIAKKGLVITPEKVGEYPKFDVAPEAENKVYIGGPSQPEMSSFKSVGVDNMVNTFTGDFSYNIPLLDVGGYPVNIYYTAGIDPEQEASWVGLGWNINPGNINRSMRGVPDDFDGSDTLVQQQNVRENRTFGAKIGLDFEFAGNKPIEKLMPTISLGFTLNNKLGPSVEGGASWNFNISQNLLRNNSTGHSTKQDTSATLGLNLGMNFNTSSRSGASLGLRASLSFSYSENDDNMSQGIGVATSYSSRAGLREMSLFEQRSYSKTKEKDNAEKKSNVGFSNMASSSISFLKPSYIPALRPVLTNKSWAGRFEIGPGPGTGFRLGASTELFGQTSTIEPEDQVQKKAMVGYIYSEKAVGNPNVVMDFNRLNDKEVTAHTPIVSAPQYSYDVFSIQGEGTGGSFRAYRNDYGYMRDKRTTSKDKSISAGIDIGPWAHFGGSFSQISTPTVWGDWEKGNDIKTSFNFLSSDSTFERVYFRNPGESSFLDSERISKIGGVDLVRFQIGGSETQPQIVPTLNQYNKYNQLIKSNPIAGSRISEKRNKRSQVISFLTAKEASEIGMDRKIRSYDLKKRLDSLTKNLRYTEFERIDGYRKSNHISQINVTEADGKRYIYGIPVYNLTQKDFTFSVDNSYTTVPSRVLINQTQMSLSSPLLTESTSANRDGSVTITQTPAYAHSFLLTGLVSSDYVDVTNNGITEDDLGTAVRFNYSKLLAGDGVSPLVHKWRTPLTAGDSANFMPGSKTEVKDDQAFVSYGERESWYLHSIESKSMIAFFYLSNRDDSKGPLNQYGQIDASDSSSQKLDSIALFNKADLKKNGLTGARPIKTVHFRYSYKLCNNTPDHATATDGKKGKLTLDSLFFTYNGVRKSFINKYSFKYTYNDTSDVTSNPDYSPNTSDRWGVYKASSLNPASLPNADFPYTPQDKSKKQQLDANAGAWCLKRITIPSGGEITVNYEADEYSFVQNKRAQYMVNVLGFGSSSAGYDNSLYGFNGGLERDYVFVKLPTAVSSVTDLFNRYLSGIEQLAFRITVTMPKGKETIPCYATFSSGSYGLVSGKDNVAWIKLDKVGGYNPISLQIMEHLIENLPGQAYPGYDVSNTSGMQQIGVMMNAALTNLFNLGVKPYTVLRGDGKARLIDTSSSFVRLNVPDMIKYGGGHRVKSITISDQWNKLTSQYTSVYGQNYDYSTIESTDFGTAKISSGVASYEPSIGGDENPWQTMLKVENRVPLGPTNFDAIEMPILDALFQSPLVGYRKVSVTSLKKTMTNKKSRSGVGKQVSEYYTAKDFPVFTQYSKLDPDANKEAHDNGLNFSFLHKITFDYRAISQGFLVVLNDMHGKLKSQSSYAENDTATRISYTQNFYTNTGKNGLNDKVNFILSDSSGKMVQGNMGVDVELMTDAREFKMNSKTVEAQANVDFIGWIFPLITVWPTIGKSESIYRAITTTKVVNYHSILDSIIVEDKGSVVSTKNLAYDFYTGDVIVSRTNNEFKKPIYNTSYPAYWAYSGMGLAYKNIDLVYKDVDFQDGKIISGFVNLSNFESGDEIYIMGVGSNNVSECFFYLSTPQSTKMMWVVDKNKNSSSLTNSTRDLYFIDERGQFITLNKVTFRVVRSGKRNLLGDRAASVVSAVNPTELGKLTINSNSKVINTSAVEYKEKWLSEADVFPKVKLVFDTSQCKLVWIEDENGSLEKSINPYLKGILGNFKQYRSLVFYNNRKEKDTISQTNISSYGYLDSMKLYWDFNAMNNLIPDTTNKSWVWNSKIAHINSKNLEVETVDPLGIYTGAQYGYNKTLPVAIANNSRYYEFFVEGFEDYQYSESINKTTFNKTVRHIDFSRATNASIVDTDTLGFRAHTGKYALSVSGTSILNIPVQVPKEEFRLNTVSRPLPTLVKGTLGGVIQSTSSSVTWQVSGSNPGSASLQFTNANTVYNTGSNVGGVEYTIEPFISSSNYTSGSMPSVNYSYTVTTKQYIEVRNEGTFKFNFRTTNPFIAPSSSTQFPQINTVTIVDTVNNISYPGTFLYSTVSGTSYIKTRQYCLPKGVYVMTMQFLVGGRNYSCSSGSSCNFGAGGLYLMQDKFAVTDDSYPSSNSIQFFRTYSTVVNCSYTEPFNASDSMFKIVYSPTVEKKMVLSAWVRENCGNLSTNIPCKQAVYTNNQIQLKFLGTSNSTINFLPTGPIIDGWQRYEAVFTVPFGTTNIELSFMNTGSGSVYFDDIRVHPFNSNVKGYVYDPVNLRLTSEIDANNYASFYEYDPEGTLIRTKVETKEGIKTINETRSALQKIIK